MVELIFQKILLSLAIGALVGLERERRAKGETVAGFRTFMLVTLFGLLSGYMSGIFSSFVPIYAGLFSIGILAGLSYYAKFSSKKSIGLTTEIALILSFIIGLIVFFDVYPFFLTVSLGIILTLVLFSLETSHSFAKRIKQVEIRDAVIFAVLAFIILPLLPNNAIDPIGALNPYKIWLSIVIVLSVSFAAYIAMKIFGSKYGSVMTGLLGGLVSSTAVSVDMADKVRKNKKILYSAAFAVIIASSTMFLRQLFVASAINHNLFIPLLLPMTILGVVGYIFSYIYWKKNRSGKSAIEIKSPLSLKSALQFSILLVVVLTVSKLAENYFGSTSIIAVALIAGLLDSDAMTISLSSLALNGLLGSTAVVGIILVGLSNTFMKWLLVRWLGNRKISAVVGKVFLVIIAVGILLASIMSFVRV